MELFFIVWAVVALIMFGLCSYSIGSVREEDGDDIAGLFFFAFVLSLFWPIVFALFIIFGPFYFLYKLGKKRARIEQEKKQIWNTLKN